MKLEVDEFYLTEDGRIIQIVEYGKYRFLDKDDFIYDENGIDDETYTSRNLIAHIPKELHHHLLSMIPLFYENPHFRKQIETKYNNLTAKA